MQVKDFQKCLILTLTSGGSNLLHVRLYRVVKQQIVFEEYSYVAHELFWKQNQEFYIVVFSIKSLIQNKGICKHFHWIYS